MGLINLNESDHFNLLYATDIRIVLLINLINLSQQSIDVLTNDTYNNLREMKIIIKTNKTLGNNNYIVKFQIISKMKIKEN